MNVLTPNSKVASQKLALNTSKKGLTNQIKTNLGTYHHLPERKKLQIAPSPHRNRGFFPFNTPHPTDPSEFRTHLERTHLLRQLVEATASIQALQNVRNIDDLRRLAGRLAPVGAPAALRIHKTTCILVPSCWALLGIIYLTSRWWEGVAFLGGEAGRFSCDSCGNSENSACLLFCVWSNTHRCDEQKKM